MPFKPEAGSIIMISNSDYRFAEHPSAPGMPYGQAGRAGTVYQLIASDGRKLALKVFLPRFSTPAVASQAEKLRTFADIPGLQVCQRTVLTPQNNYNILRLYQGLTYAVLMDWVEGSTWMEVMMEKRTFTVEQSLSLGRGLAEVLSQMEQRGVAHCDLSGSNVLLPGIDEGDGDISLVDVEGLYGPGLPKPEQLPSGSTGYGHRTAEEGLWSAEADRFAGAVLMAEMLGWCDERVRQASSKESYFDSSELQREGERYQILKTVLRERWGSGVGELFERAWTSETLADCPTMGEWLAVLPMGEPVKRPMPVIPAMVELQVFPNYLEFGALDLTRKPVVVQQIILKVRNAGGGLLTGQIEEKVSWLKVAPKQFTCAAGMESTHIVTLGINAPKVNAGQGQIFTDGLVIHSNQRDQSLSGSYGVIQPKGHTVPLWVYGLGILVLILIIGGIYVIQSNGGDQLYYPPTMESPGIASSPDQINTPLPTFTALPTVTLTPPQENTIDDPKAFIQYYYSLYNTKSYELAYSYLSDKFKKLSFCCNPDGSYKYDEYVADWKRTEKVELTKIDILVNQSDFVKMQVFIRYFPVTGNPIDGKPLFIELISDSNSHGWIINQAYY
jgi:serine/threonine protein kinase